MVCVFTEAKWKSLSVEINKSLRYRNKQTRDFLLGKMSKRNRYYKMPPRHPLTGGRQDLSSNYEFLNLTKM